MDVDLSLSLGLGMGRDIDGSMSTEGHACFGALYGNWNVSLSPANKCLFTRQQKPKQLVGIRIYTYTDKHTYTHTHTATVSSNIIEVWQWKANRKTHTKVYMLKQLLSLQKIGFLLRKWFEASPLFGYLTYTLTIRRYENTPRKFSLQTERKIFNFYYFPLSLSLCQFD